MMRKAKKVNLFFHGSLNRLNTNSCSAKGVFFMVIFAVQTVVFRIQETGLF